MPVRNIHVEEEEEEANGGYANRGRVPWPVGIFILDRQRHGESSATRERSRPHLELSAGKKRATLRLPFL